MKMNRGKLMPLIFITLLIIMPILSSHPFLMHSLILCLVYAVIITNWNLTMGYMGIFNFAHFSFFAIGAYSSTILATSFDVSPWFGIFAGGSVAGLASFMLGLPALRLKGIYFALFSFAFQQTIYSFILINVGGLTGGSMGLVFIPPFQLGSIILSRTNKIPAYYLALMIFLISTFCLYNIINSHVGLAFKALRDSEHYAISRGINPYKYKLIAMFISAFFTGMIGSFYAHYIGTLGPAILGWEILILGLAMLVIGGLGTFFGPITAAFVLTLISEHLTGLGAYRFLIISLVMIVALLITPSEVSKRLRLFVTSISKRFRRYLTEAVRR